MMVCKTPGTVEVRRTDGNPLRIQIVSVGPDGSTTRSDVFSTPVDVLRLRRTARVDGSRRWVVGHVPACRDVDVLQLVETIVSFAIAKRNRGRGDGRVRLA